MTDAETRRAIEGLWWMARRYADGRQSYATAEFNSITRQLVANGYKCDDNGERWAKDQMGRAYDGLSEEEASQ